MKKKRSVSVLKSNSNLHLNNKHFFRDPSFTTRFEGLVLQKDLYTRNLYTRHLGDSVVNKPRKLMRLGPNEVIISPYCLKTKTHNNIFNSSLEQRTQRDYSNPYKKKYGELNFGPQQNSGNISLKKSFSWFNNHIPSFKLFDKYTIALQKSIDKIDEKYKRQLCMLDPLPKLFVFKRRYPYYCDKIKNQYIKEKIK